MTSGISSSFTTSEVAEAYQGHASSQRPRITKGREYVLWSMENGTHHSTVVGEQ